MTVRVPDINSTTVRTSWLLRSVGLGLRTLDMLAPNVAARKAADVFLTPRRMRRPPREQEWAEAAIREVREVAGRRIVTWSWGEGDPVLLIHGWEGRASQMAAFAHSAHGVGVRWIGIDLPAHGDSPGRRTNLIEIAEVIGSLIEDIAPRGIVAHSFGAAGTSVALQGREFPGGLVYLAPPEDFNFFTRVFGAMLGIPDDLATRMQGEIERRLDIDWSLVRGTEIAREMNVPLLIVHDEEDFDVPHRFGRALAESWPDARLLTTRGLGHRRILRDEDVIRSAVEFILGPAEREDLTAASGSHSMPA